MRTDERRPAMTRTKIITTTLAAAALLLTGCGSHTSSADPAPQETTATPTARSTAHDPVVTPNDMAPAAHGTAGPGLTYEGMEDLTMAYRGAGGQCDHPTDHPDGGRECEDGTWLIMAHSRFSPEGMQEDGSMEAKARRENLYFVRLHNAYLVNADERYLTQVHAPFGGFIQGGKGSR